MRATEWVLAIGLLALANVADAQILTGTIIGTVRDESGAVLPGATVTLTSPALPAEAASSATNANGEYRFTDLPPGSYAVKIELAGFGPYQEQGLRVVVGGTIERIVTLKLAAVAETVTVNGATPMVDPRKPGVASNIEQEVLRDLPISRFAIYEFTKWTVGATPNDPGGTSGAVSVMGAADSENSVLYDSQNSNTPMGSSAWQSGIADTVGEVQVITLGASAEYQVAQGAVVNVIFKSGTNQFRADGSGYWYPDRLISKPILRPCNCPYGQTGFVQGLLQDYAAELGGPIVKDHLWFWNANKFSRRKSSNPGTNPDFAALWFGHGNLIKPTWQPNARLRFSQTLNITYWDTPPSITVNRPLETISHGPGWTPLFVSEMTATLSNNTYLTARYSGMTNPDHISYPFTFDVTTPFRLNEITNIGCCGVPNFGGSSFGRSGPSAKLNKFVSGKHVEHDLRVGFQAEWANYHTYSTQPSGVNYADLGTVNGMPVPDQATYRNPYVSGAASNAQGVWAEDQMTVGGRLTLNLGIRFDRMHGFSPDEPAVNTQLHQTGQIIKGLSNMFTWNVAAPRLGFNYKLTDDGRTIARAAYGRAYRTIFLNDFVNVHPGLSPITLARWNPVMNSYSTIVSVTDPIANLAVDPHLKPPFTDSYSAGVDRELAAGLGLKATYVHKRGENLIGWVDIGGIYGTRTDVLPDGRTIGDDPLLNSSSARKFLRTNGPGTFTNYNGMLVTLDKRLSHNWRASVSYTYSKSEGFVTTQQDPNGNINASGLQDYDRPNVVIANGSYEFPGIALQVVADYMGATGRPFAPQALVSLPQGRLLINIAPVDGTYRFSRQDIVTLRFIKQLFRQGNTRIEVGTEIRNLLQNEGISNLLTQNYYTSTFGQGSTWVDPRRMIFFARAWF